MHESAYEHMSICVERYMKKDQKYRVLDLGAAISPGQSLTHRRLFAPYSVQYVGIDIVENENVDHVMPRPYTFPIPSRSVDILISGQVFEHIPFVWATAMEIARVLRPGGYAFICAPSRGHQHNVYDCWRFYPDAYRALAAWSGLELREAFTDMPPLRVVGGVMHDYTRITPRSYWGDSVGVFQRTGKYPRLQAGFVRAVNQWWGNKRADLGHVPMPTPGPTRRSI